MYRRSKGFAVSVLAAAVFAGTWLAVAGSSTPVIRASDRTLAGRTIVQWHKLAVKRRIERDTARSKAGVAIREGRMLKRTIRSISAHDTVLTDPRERNMLCIHGFEGSWTDPNSPYWGGLQMDLEFQKTYGLDFYNAWGTADHWPASVQIAVALRAYLTRGYGPWPNTARYCGLL